MIKKPSEGPPKEAPLIGPLEGAPRVGTVEGAPRVGPPEGAPHVGTVEGAPVVGPPAGAPKGIGLRLPTPCTSHLKEEEFRVVYEPSEDTFLMMDALEIDAETLQELQPALVLEMGCGSGCVSAFLSSLFKQYSAHAGDPQGPPASNGGPQGPPSSTGGPPASTGGPPRRSSIINPVIYAVDKQRAALEAARRTFSVNVCGELAEFINSDLFRGFKGFKSLKKHNTRGGPPSSSSSSSSSVQGVLPTATTAAATATTAAARNSKGGPFDLIIFNPPYVQGDTEENIKEEDLPWWGGEKGRKVIDEFAAQVLLLERENAPEEVVEELTANGCEARVRGTVSFRVYPHLLLFL
ncbi:hypothetical protein, conserved [Eimeria acervulina]|uniref:Methyltransferase small domain-containing protein n=1 Tax=Eimeria acervulina TaxID=5801 RepID=U6GHL4_EIMAC|nr:hypothetical protein, conserved [Eimeria acervulina]CDI78783.1 hypothetical protein, conserved [Eimeria acervulina]